MQLLPMSHNSPETAYIVEDYPYSFRLRCQMRVWLEYKKRHGYRMVTQTSNPRKPTYLAPCPHVQEGSGLGTGENYCDACQGPRFAVTRHWNAPKKGIYAAVVVLYLDDVDHVQCAHLTMYRCSLEIENFIATYGAVLEERAANIAKGMLALARAYEAKKPTYTIQGSDPMRVV